MKIHEFSKISVLPATGSGTAWGTGGRFTRAGTAPGDLLRRLRRPQEAAGGAEVCGMSQGESTRSYPIMENMKIMKNHENLENS